jgi:rhodanese-related sulfurtransferase
VKLNSGKIILIVILSSLIGVVVNYINPKGIPLIGEKKELAWAEDSLFNIFSVDSSKQETKDYEEHITSNKTEHKFQEHEVISEGKEQEQKIYKREESQALEQTKVESFKEPEAITLEQAYALYKQGVIFIDAREVADYEAGHIINSINIPFDYLDDYRNKLEKLNKGKPVVTYCAGTECDLSILLGEQLFEMGFNQVYVFFGGWLDWLEAKYPTETSTKSETE